MGTKIHTTHKSRILFVGHTAQLGGGELALVNLVAHLDRTRVEPLVLLFADGPLRQRLEPYAPVTIYALAATVATTHRDKVSLAALTRFQDIFTTLIFVLRLRDKFRELDASLIHTNSLKADLLGGVAARLAGIPVVWHLRDRIAADYLPAPVVKVFRFFARIIPRYIIANSTATLTTLHAKLQSDKALPAGEGRFRARTCVVHDGIPDVSLPRKRKDRDGLVIGIVGRLSPWKGQDVFIKAAEIVRRRFPATTFRIIGAPLFGEEDFQEKLLELCRNLDMTRTIEFTGFVSNVPEAIEDLDILVHASTLPEPFGQVIIEGMAAAKPVVATNGGGVPEIVIDGSTGILVSMGSELEMSTALIYLIENPEARREMGARGKKRVADDFHIATTARRVERVYDLLLGAT